MNVQFQSLSILDRDAEDVRFQARAAAALARHTRHKQANTCTRQLTLSFLIQPLHLRDKSFKWSLLFAACSRFIGVAAYFDWCPVRAEVDRVFDFIRQIG